jgi:hypothetical protein
MAGRLAGGMRGWMDGRAGGWMVGWMVGSQVLQDETSGTRAQAHAQDSAEGGGREEGGLGTIIDERG